MAALPATSYMYADEILKNSLTKYYYYYQTDVNDQDNIKQAAILACLLCNENLQVALVSSLIGFYATDDLILPIKITRLD